MKTHRQRQYQCPRRPAFTLIELLVVIAMIAVLIALLLPAVQSAREAARRAQCTNNLMQLSIAVQNYETAHEVLPPGVVNETSPVRAIPKGFHMSWIAQILPYIDQKNIYDHLNFSFGAYSSENMSARPITIRTLLCPSQSTMAAPGQSDYAGCHNDVEAPIASNNTGVFFLNSGIRFEEIPDGSSNTIFLSEKKSNAFELGWISGTSSTLRNTGSPPSNNSTSPTFGASVLGDDEEGEDDGATKPVSKTKADATLMVGSYSSFHPGGAVTAFGDGSVRFLKSTINTRIYRFLGNRADGEMIGADQY
ncbi:DUF1559 family PulG-like putative transporter [Singulisphaera rosea]